VAQLFEGRWIVSPQDIVAEFECSHRVALNAALVTGSLDFVATPNPALDLLRQQGDRHEEMRLESLVASSRVKQLGLTSHSIEAYSAGWEATRRAMDEGYDAIYQATLFTGDFVGFADFLIIGRDIDGNPLRDSTGRLVYEPVDAKSARSAKRSAVLQVGAYADALVQLGRPRPHQIHLWLAGDEDWSGPADPFIAVSALYRGIVQERLPQLGAAPVPTWASPRESCARCRFASLCDEGRHIDRDLSLVQGIHSTTRQRLLDNGISTIDELASAPIDQRPARVGIDTFERLVAQAGIQIRGEGHTPPLFEITNEHELTLLPPRSALDMWFDMEGDPYAPGPHGLEYMFGFGSLDAEAFSFATFEAHTPEEEKAAFEAFVDEVMRRRAEDPNMHVYHYANYEQSALQRLAQQYGTREAQMDSLLKDGVFVDLYRIVQRGLRFSTESLSLKYIEAVYGVTHSDEDVATAMDSVIQYEVYASLRRDGRMEEAEHLLAKIRSYNKLDCMSTMELDTWLRTLIDDTLTKSAGNQTSMGDGGEATEPADPHADLIQELESGLPSIAEDRSPEDMARALLAAALLYHPRERRPAWWQLFELIKAEREELDRASNVLVTDGGSAGEWSKSSRMKKHRRRLDLSSSHEDPRLVLEGADSAFLLYDPAPPGMVQPSDSLRGYNSASIESLAWTHVEVEERSGVGDVMWDALPIAVLPGAPYNTTPIRNAIATAAAFVLPENNDGTWSFPHAAWADLLLSRTPRSQSAQLPDTNNPISDICAALRESADSYVAVQGPPGTGKTYVGSRAVAQLAAEGWRIGVVAQSHAVVDNFLEAVHTFHPSTAIGKEPQGNSTPTLPWHVPNKVDAWARERTGGFVIGGTAWTFSREAVRNLQLDLLVIDEAGQFALPNAIACALAAQRVLLLGDPQQLPQVSQAAHPEAMERSVLEHVIDHHATMPADRGYFLDRTYRMHPALTHAVSRLQYEGRLLSAPVTEMRHLDGFPAGISPITMDHHGNTTSSIEEAKEVANLVQRLIGSNWTDARDDQVEPIRPLGQTDIIVVAAYNAQVRLIRRHLDDSGFPNIEVGTVDKFQGKEAPVVIVSMATSSAEDLPRGLEFLLSPNRLNVAVSRAEWASFVIHSPGLLTAQPSSVEGVRRLGLYLNLVSHAPNNELAK